MLTEIIHRYVNDIDKVQLAVLITSQVTLELHCSRWSET